MDSAKNIHGASRRLSLGNISRPVLLLLFLFMLIIFVALAVMSDNWSGSRVINRINVTGTRFAEASAIKRLVSDSLEGMMIRDIDLDKIRKKIAVNPYVKNVRINPMFNGALQISITERSPIAVTPGVNGELLFCDESGKLFPFVITPERFDYPVITGNGSIKAAASALARIAAGEGELIRYVSEIGSGRGKATYEIVTSDFGYRLIVDGSADINAQLSKYEQFLKSDLAADADNSINYIDLRWEKRIVIGKS